MIELRTDADGALAAGAHEGVLTAGGRMIVGSVLAEVYRRIEEHVRKGASADTTAQPENAAAITTKSAKGASADAPSQPEIAAATTTTKSASEQNANTAFVGPNSAAPSQATPAAPATGTATTPATTAAPATSTPAPATSTPAAATGREARD